MYWKTARKTAGKALIVCGIWVSLAGFAGGQVGALGDWIRGSLEQVETTLTEAKKAFGKACAEGGSSEKSCARSFRRHLDPAVAKNWSGDWHLDGEIVSGYDKVLYFSKQVAVRDGKRARDCLIGIAVGLDRDSEIRYAELTDVVCGDWF